MTSGILSKGFVNTPRRIMQPVPSTGRPLIRIIGRFAVVVALTLSGSLFFDDLPRHAPPTRAPLYNRGSNPALNACARKGSS